MKRLFGSLVGARWWILGVLLLAGITAITLSEARTPADRFEVWKLILDKGAFALLIAIAGTILKIVIEKRKAAEAWATEVARERIAVGRRLMKSAQDVFRQHVKFRIAQQRGLSRAANRLMEARNEATLDLAAAAVDGAMFFDKPLALAFQNVIAKSTELLKVAAFYPGAVEIESEALNDVMREATTALRVQISRELPMRKAS